IRARAGDLAARRLMFSRVLVANRGEIAVRVIRALHELDVEAVAVYSSADEGALHVRLADRAVRIGPPQASESYPRIPSPTAAAEEAGYPVLLKASAGGGGKGMRLVGRPEQLASAYSTASMEAEAAFGDGSLYLEKAISPARHVEIQVLADGEGGVLTLGERECSIQRRHQKLIEESPSPALTPERREEMEAAAERACETIGYRNAGTFEFLLGPDGAFYFIELNARLQVEHPVSELVTGIDIVREQLRIAAGERLARTGRADRRGHAIEVRLNAEDPTRGFVPSPGRITRFRPPLGPGIRLDTHVEEGTAVPPHYDSLLGKLIVWDESRPEAIARALRALGELQLDGVPTTRALAIDVLRSEGFANGRYSTEYLAEAAAALPALTGS